MGTIHSEHGRHGMPPRAFESVRHFIDHACQQRFLIDRDGAVATPREGPFVDWLTARPDADPAEVFRAFLVHEHYIWNSARPRSAQATLELRSACQQPGDEHMVSAALGLATVEAAEELARWIEEDLGQGAWAKLAAWHHDVITQGLASTPPSSGFVEGVLDRCESALADRGRGEERYLAPLRRRWDARESPGQASCRVFREEGMAGLVKWARIDA
jgi:hypothetical protein